MSIEQFFQHFLKEIKKSDYLGDYYKFHKDESSFLFRKNYFLKRLDYIDRNIEKNNSNIWDCGCGYGTTAIYLALKGHNVFGNTVGNYYDKIPKRIEYWSQFGDISKFEYSYYIIAQDSLHHIEPIRSFKEWENLFHEHNMYLDDFEYIRLYLPFLWTEKKL